MVSIYFKTRVDQPSCVFRISPNLTRNERIWYGRQAEAQRIDDHIHRPDRFFQQIDFFGGLRPGSQTPASSSPARHAPRRPARSESSLSSAFLTVSTTTPGVWQLHQAKFDRQPGSGTGDGIGPQRVIQPPGVQ